MEQVPTPPEDGALSRNVHKLPEGGLTPKFCTPVDLPGGRLRSSRRDPKLVNRFALIAVLTVIFFAFFMTLLITNGPWAVIIGALVTGAIAISFLAYAIKVGNGPPT